MNQITIPKNKQEVSLPTNYVLVLDTSGSMYGEIPALKSTLKSITKNGKVSDTVSIGRFSSSGDFEFFVRGLPYKDVNLTKLIDSKIVSTGCTCFNEILNAVPNLVKDLKNLNNNKNFSFFFLSDGQPNDNSPLDKTIKICSDLKSLFNTSRIIGYGRYYGRQVLLDMAKAISGQFFHIENATELDGNYATFFENKTTKVSVKFSAAYDVVFQVTNDGVLVYDQEKDNSVLVDETEGESFLYGFNLSDVDTFTKKDLQSGEFAYGAAVALSKKNKANLGVKLLIKAGDASNAERLRKAFTVSAKGIAENYISKLAKTNKKVVQSEKKLQISLKELFKFFADNIPNGITLDLSRWEYNKTTKSGKNVSKVETEYTNHKNAKITKIVTHSDRVNLSLQTVRDINITSVNDDDLSKRVKDYNKTAKKNQKITFPISSVTFRTYSIISNGDFNVKVIPLVLGNGTVVDINMDDVSIFDSENKTITAKEFASKVDLLVKTKAKKTAINYLRKEALGDSFVKDDKRVALYGEEGAKLVEEMGLDSEMRYSPKEEYIAVDANMDYIMFTSITGTLDKCSSFSAPNTVKKLNEGKSLTVSENILAPTIKEYQTIQKTLNNSDKFIKYCDDALDTLDVLVDAVNSELVATKFYLAVTNDWFSDVPKSEEVRIGDVIIKVKEEKEYL